MGVIPVVILLALLGHPVLPAYINGQSALPAPLDGLNPNQKRSVSEYIKQHEVLAGELRVLADPDQVWLRSSKVLADLFPEYRFVVVPWIYELDPQAKNKYSIPGGLFDVLAIDEHGIVHSVFYSSGNREQYGEFLKTMRTKVSNNSDAARLGEAMAAIYGDGSSNNLRHGASEWYLNYQEAPFRAISGYDQVREAYYFHLQTDPQGFVLGGKLEVQTLERRKIQQPSALH
jgi:hypothetical protein